jgi:hypothetical protein
VAVAAVVVITAAAVAVAGVVNPPFYINLRRHQQRWCLFVFLLPGVAGF